LRIDFLEAEKEELRQRVELTNSGSFKELYVKLKKLQTAFFELNHECTQLNEECNGQTKIRKKLQKKQKRAKSVIKSLQKENMDLKTTILASPLKTRNKKRKSRVKPWISSKNSRTYSVPATVSRKIRENQEMMKVSKRKIKKSKKRKIKKKKKSSRIKIPQITYPVSHPQIDSPTYDENQGMEIRLSPLLNSLQSELNNLQK